VLKVACSILLPLSKTKNQPCGTCRRAGATVIFACGEFYCFAAVFGYRRVIFATRAWGANIISLRPSGAISLLRSKNITLTGSAYHLQFDMAFVSTNAVLVKKGRRIFAILRPFPVSSSILLYGRHRSVGFCMFHVKHLLFWY